LCAGDVLVAFTDGISEAMNHDDAEWGEERLRETIEAGAKQHGDMTLVVLRALPEAPN